LIATLLANRPARGLRDIVGSANHTEMAMQRREFMMGAAAAAGLMVARRSWAQTGDSDKRARIAIMMFGLNNIVKNNMPASPTRTLDIMDIGQVCADRYRVHQVELQSNYFPSTEMSWLKDFKSRLDKTKTKVVQVNLEFGAGYNMGADAPSGRLQMIDLHRAWFDKLAFLECPRVLLNQGQPTPENRELIISNYKAVVELAKAKGIKAASENRNAPGGGRGGAGAAAQPGGQAAATPPPVTPPPAPAPGPPSYILLTEILKASGTLACADMLNFPSQEEQLAGIRAMLPINHGLLHAGIRHDLPAAMKICRELNYKGLYSIKAAGLQGDPLENTQKILDGVLAEM
jgi:hypothetical protein